MNDQKRRLWNTSKGDKSSERVVRKEIRSANSKQTKGVKCEREREKEKGSTGKGGKSERQRGKEERSANKRRSEEREREREREREKGSSGSTIEMKRRTLCFLNN
jgi:hypothetical protein